MNNPAASTGRVRLWPVLFIALLASFAAFAAPQFPELTGRVVDNGEFLSPAAEQRISQQLQAHEQATTNQVVVVTLPDLQGYAIEDFGYQLGRHWGIGQKGEDNGVLLIVAREERKMRIEVGYGLEGTLTDAISSNIVNTVITPAFKQGQFEAGISQGVTAIIAALGGEYRMQEPQRPQGKRDAPPLLAIIIFFIVMFLFSGPFGGMFLGGHRGFYTGGFGGRGGGFGGGGFGGGGGGFGGGGASGGW